MARPRRFTEAPVSQNSVSKPRRFLRAALISLAAGATLVLALAVGATNVLLRGHVSITEHRTPSKAGVSAPNSTAKSTDSGARNQSGGTSDLVDRYGTPASWPAVAAEIKKAENGSGANNADPAAGAKFAADRAEALGHGVWKPGADPMTAVMYGYVPPGMSQEQAAMLYRSMPHLPRVPGPMTPEQIARIAGEPADPLAASLPEGLTSNSLQAANQAQLEKHLREKFGPGFVLPQHTDHSWLAQHARKTANGFVVARDNQISPIPAQYAYDPSPPTPGVGSSIREMTNSSGNIVRQYSYDPWGNVTVLQGSGPDSDFQYAGYYYHARSGLYLTKYRAYNPVLGRWLSRDPIGESWPMQQEPGSMSVRADVENSMKNWVGGTTDTINRRLVSMIRNSNNSTSSASLLKALRVHGSVRGPGGTNLYTYVRNEPIGNIDVLGLACVTSSDPEECMRICREVLHIPVDQCLDFCYGD